MEALELSDYRAAVARIYLDAADLADFRARRDKLFGTHPQSPVPAASFTGLRYYPPNDDAIVTTSLRVEPGEIQIDTGGPDGTVRYTRVGVLPTPFGELSLWWIAAYGGGLFLPVRDGTCGSTTYGGGRHREGHPRAGPDNAGRRPGAARLQLPVQPVLRLRRRLAVPAGAAGEPGVRADRGR
jgi:uncharacterized protein